MVQPVDHLQHFSLVGTVTKVAEEQAWLLNKILLPILTLHSLIQITLQSSLKGLWVKVVT